MLLLQFTQWLMRHGRNVLDLDLCIGDGTANWTRFKSGSVGLLALMPNLARLDLLSHGKFFMPSRDMYATQYLTSLGDLRLDLPCCGEWAENVLEPLSGLKELKRLEITVSGMTTPLLVHSSLTSLTGLTGLHLARQERREDYNPNLIDTDNIISVISHLTGLKWLQLHSVMHALPRPLLNLKRLSYLSCGSCNLWSGLSNLPDRHAWTCLRTVFLAHIPTIEGSLWLALCQLLSVLPALSELAFANIDLLHLCSRDWPFNQRLQRLSIIDCNLSSLPMSLQHLNHLHRLVLVNARVFSLKALGRPLGQLQELVLTTQHALHAAAEVHEAKSLTKLDLEYEPKEGLPSVPSCTRILQPRLPVTCVLNFFSGGACW